MQNYGVGGWLQYVIRPNPMVLNIISYHNYELCYLLTGNECLTQLSLCLQSHFAPFCPELLQYILRQFDFADLPSNDHGLSLVTLVLQVHSQLYFIHYLKDPQAALPIHLITIIIATTCTCIRVWCFSDG